MKLTNGSYRAILRKRNVRLLFLAQTISALGTWIGLVALNSKIYNLTHSSLGVAGLFLFMAAPSLLFGLMGGVYVDRFNRQRLLVAADSIRVVLTLLMLAAETAVFLYALVFLNALAGVVYRMARLAIVPQIAADKEDLLTTNALLNAAQTLTLVLGPAVGGLLIAALGVKSAFIIDAASFALSAGLIARMGMATAVAPQPPAGRTWGQIQTAVAFVRQNRPVAALILSTAAIMLGTGAVNALEIVYARTVLHTDDAGYGLLIASWGLGLFLGTLVVGRASRYVGDGRLYLASMALLGATLALYAYAPNLIVAIVIGIIGGVGNGLFLNLAQTLLQTLTPVEMLGRVGGFFTTVRDVTLFLSMLAAGTLADVVGVQILFAVAGLIVLVSVAIPPLLAESRASRLDWLAPSV
ncbi:MAG: MFS transporter [Chloroflexi bacterium]|nr:MFS transporter [Chloroflexota bacterium]